jgi:hypothetical protein
MALRATCYKINMFGGIKILKNKKINIAYKRQSIAGTLNKNKLKFNFV